jgi:hypothetical protein
MAKYAYLVAQADDGAITNRAHLAGRSATAIGTVG